VCFYSSKLLRDAVLLSWRFRRRNRRSRRVPYRASRSEKSQSACRWNAWQKRCKHTSSLRFERSSEFYDLILMMVHWQRKMRVCVCVYIPIILLITHRSNWLRNCSPRVITIPVFFFRLSIILTFTYEYRHKTTFIAQKQYSCVINALNEGNY